MSNPNPENKCARLWFDEEANKQIDILNDSVNRDFLKEIFTMQQALQKRLGREPGSGPLVDRIEAIKENFHHFCVEYAELMERTPHKHWKTYSDEVKADFTSEEHKLECWYEWCDMFHFFVNMGLLLGIDAEAAFKLYYTKNKENFARQDRGY